MAQMYNMPPDTSAREKIVGGILDIVQLGFLIGGIAVGLLIGLVFKPIMGTAGMIIGLLPGVGAGLFLGLFKIKGLSVVQYLKYKKLHKYKTKKLPNVRLCALSKEEIEKIRNF